jgi:hypothetical protein
MPSLNQVASMDLALTDATGSGADLVPVAIRPAPAQRETDPIADARFPMPVSLRPRRKDLEINEIYIRGL